MRVAAGRGMLAAFVFALAIVLASYPVHAQVVSEGRGELTLTIGEGSGPLGGIPADVVAGQRTGSTETLRHLGFRFVAGYQFATHWGFAAGVTHAGHFVSDVAYGNADRLSASTTFDAIEADLVAKLPIAPVVRVDLTAGLAATGLKTNLATVLGSALPLTQPAAENSKHLNLTGGVDVELRISDHIAAIVGAHAYPHVGSSRLVGSASGTVSLLAAGVHFEF